MIFGHRQRRLRTLVVTATLLGVSLTAVAQATPTPSPPTPKEAASAAPPSPVQANPPVPHIDATPEQIADSLMAHQRYQAAIEQYQKAPRSSELWTKTGVAYQLMLNLDESIQCYEKALKLDPKNVIALNNLGTVYVTTKQYSRAEKLYHKALKIDPDSALVHKNLGTALLARHKYKKGWQEYQNALADDPQIFQSTNAVRVENPGSVQERGAMNYYMAKGCLRAGQADRAIEYLRLAINEGFITPKKVATDNEFAGLRNLPAFKQMLALQRTQ
jgi:tetratricopeptide (TPR) repeat protein